MPTVHAVVLNVALASRISSGDRGKSGLVPGDSPSRMPGTSSGASQKTYHFSRSITSWVISTPSSRNGFSCW